MDGKSIEKIESMKRLTDFLLEDGRVCSRFKKLACACFDRAILLPDIPGNILRSEFEFNAEQLNYVQKLSNKIAVEFDHEKNIVGRHIPVLKDPRQFDSFSEFSTALVPVGWSAVEFVCAVPSPTGAQLQRALEQVFKEDQLQRESILAFALCRTYQPTPERVWHKFADRVRVSGFQEGSLETVTEIHREGQRFIPVRKESRGPPQKRIRALYSQSMQQPAASDSSSTGPTHIHGSKIPWRFKSQLAREAQFRTQVKSIIGSWQSTGSALFSWHLLMGALASNSPEFPVKTEMVAAYSTCIDNPGTLDQYLKHIRNAHRLLNLPAFEANISAIIRGANKGSESLSTTRSFLTRAILEKIFDILHRERLQHDEQIVSACKIGYHYQLRAHSELFIICRDSRATSELYTTVEFSHSNGHKIVTLTLSRRKHRPFLCRIARACWCKIAPQVCGACELEKLSTQARDNSSFILSQNKSQMIKRLKEVGSRIGESKVTWHGLRRGRTVDLLRMRDSRGRPVCTLAEVFESGQWKSGSEAILSYIHSTDVDGGKLVVMYANNSDSE